MQEATSAIELAQGNRGELRSISERSRDVTTAAAELQTESNRQEAAVNEETNRTTAVLNKLATAIDTADELISNAKVDKGQVEPASAGGNREESSSLRTVELHSYLGP